MQRFLTVLILFSLVVPLASSAMAAETDSIVVYSARKEHLIKPLFKRYTQQTGTEIRYVTGKAGALLQRIKNEGPQTQADLLLTVDAGNLWHAANEGILAPIDSPALESNVPDRYQDPDNRWFGLSVRARTIVYSTERVDPDNLSTYAGLAQGRWQDRLLLRTSKKVYNQSLVASLIEAHGAEKTKKIVAGWVDNLAVAPLSSDTKVLKSILAGVGDVGIVNTYYFGRLQKENPDLPLALFWPNQDNGGVHTNISGGGMVAHADNAEGAQDLLEWLSSAEAQGLFAGLNMEYPVHPDVPAVEQVQNWGEFQASPLNVATYGARQAEAVRLMDQVDYK